MSSRQQSSESCLDVDMAREKEEEKIQITTRDNNMSIAKGETVQRAQEARTEEAQEEC